MIHAWLVDGKGRDPHPAVFLVTGFSPYIKSGKGLPLRLKFVTGKRIPEAHHGLGIVRMHKTFYCLGKQV